MFLKQVCIISALILMCCVSLTAQTNDISSLINETQTVARKTAYQAWVEFTSDFKRSWERNDKNINVEVYETLCSNKTCISILTEKNGQKLSEKEIKKNRERAGKNLDKAEKQDDSAYIKDKEMTLGYGIMIFTWFNPSLYLKVCQTDFVEKKVLENRPTVKVKVTDCNPESLLSKTVSIKSFQFMSKTEGFIWIDEQDKAISKMEIYAKKEFPNLSRTNKPLVTIESEKNLEGYWFWKKIRVEALENKAVFPEYRSNWEYEFFNYRRATVKIEKTEINNK